ncbi:MAG TPA: hypothetical protein VHL13_09325 [Pseudolabrys sp.]|nr:hypothetical protein [Pseudolabrys sp.]
MTAHQVGQHRGSALVLRGGDRDTRRAIEQLTGDVTERAVARIGRRQLRIGLGIGDQFLDRRERRVGTGRHDHRRLADKDHRREIALRVVFDILVHQLVGGGLPGRGEQDRVAVRRRARDRGRADIAAGAALVFHDEGLAELLAEIVRETARDHVRGSAGREGDHERHRSGRPRVRAGRRGLRQHGQAQQRSHYRCKFRHVLPLRFYCQPSETYFRQLSVRSGISGNVLR